MDNIHFDFLPELLAFDIKDFSKCYKNKVVTELDEVPISFISKEDLILNKKTTGRPKDEEDIENINKNSY